MKVTILLSLLLTAGISQSEDWGDWGEESPINQLSQLEGSSLHDYDIDLHAIDWGNIQDPFELLLQLELVDFEFADQINQAIAENELESVLTEMIEDNLIDQEDLASAISSNELNIDDFDSTLDIVIDDDLEEDPIDDLETSEPTDDLDEDDDDD